MFKFTIGFFAGAAFMRSFYKEMYSAQKVQTGWKVVDMQALIASTDEEMVKLREAYEMKFPAEMIHFYEKYTKGQS